MPSCQGSMEKEGDRSVHINGPVTNSPLSTGENFKINNWYTKRMSDNATKSFNAFQEKVRKGISPWKTLPAPYRIAFQQHIEDLADIVGDIEGRIGTTITNVGDNTLREEDMNYIGDLLARTTKRVLNVTNDKNKAIDILSPLAPFSGLFHKTVQEMVSEVLEEGYKTEVDRIMER